MEGFFVLVAAFNYSFGVLLSYITDWDQSTVLRIIAVFIVVFSVLEFRLGYKKKGISYQGKKTFKRMWYLIIIILVGFLITIITNRYLSSMMTTYLLNFGTRAISGVFLGIALLNNNLIEKTEKCIEPFCIFYSLLLFFVVSSNIGNSINSFEIDRQTLSYSGAFSLALLFHLNYNYDEVRKYRLFSYPFFKWINYGLIIINSYTILAGGGRGASILAFLIFLYYIRKLFKRHNRRGLVLGVLLFVGGIFSLYMLTNVSAISVGSNYIIRSFTNRFSDQSSQGRIELWIKAFDYAKKSFFLGSGAGSTAYNVGFYTHNIFIDFLVEFGIWGIVLLVWILVIVLKKSLRFSSVYYGMDFLFILFLCSFIMLLFSGSWYTEANLWISVTGIMGFEVCNDKKKSRRQRRASRFYF